MISLEPITVAYWAIRGLGAPLRMMVMYANHPLNCVQYDYDVKDGVFDRSLWANAKVPLKEDNPLINLPYVSQGGSTISQSIACATFIGRKLSMNGITDEDVSSCEMLLNEVDISYRWTTIIQLPLQKLSQHISTNMHRMNDNVISSSYSCLSRSWILEIK